MSDSVDTDEDVKGAIGPEWYVYCEGKTPKRVWGGPDARKAAIAELIRGAKLNPTEKTRIEAYANSLVPPLFHPLLVTGWYVTDGAGPARCLPDRCIIRILGPRFNSKTTWVG